MLRVKTAPFALATVVVSISCAHAAEDDFGVGGTSSGGAASTSSTSTKSSSTGTSSTTSATATSTSTSTTVTTSTTVGPTSSSSGTLGAGFYFTEYVEGTSNNKALEITNHGSSADSLAGCELEHYQNGSATAGTTTLDAVTLQPGQSFVICHTSFSQTALCDQIAGTIQHTGNDTIVLTCNGTTMDAIGRIGEDMVWGTAPTITMDATLRRKCTAVPDTNPNDAFDPAVSWDGFAVDTFADLGQYLCP